MTAGAPAPAAVLAMFRQMLPEETVLVGVYGSTEALPVSMVDSREILRETRYLSARGAGVCIGRPLAGAQVQIIAISDQPLSESDLRPLTPGQIGEITVKGPAVTASYIGREQLNRLAKIPTRSGEIIHRMGDAGYLDAQGRLWYCGRKSQRVVTPDGTLFSESVEGIFNAHPQVYRSALVGVEQAGVTQPVLWIELDPSARGADREQLRAELLELAGAHPMTNSIKTILFHPAFPTDVRHNSKIIREKLAELAKKRLR
jgi:olefin beta-lactone synthetase